MPFQQTFEEEVNANMASSPTIASSSKHNDAFYAYSQDTKQRPSSTYASDKDSGEEEAVDMDLHHKKDHPPRFSTLFTQQQPQPQPQPAVPAPLPQPVYLEPYPPPKTRKSGIYIPTPLFVLLISILFFESTLLFAYTIIGLYGNMPQPLLAMTGMSNTQTNNLTPQACENRAVNISPNFYVGDDHTHHGTDTPTTTTTTATPSLSAARSAMASDFLALLRPSASDSDSASGSGSIATVTADNVETRTSSEQRQRSTVTNVKFVTRTSDSSASEPPRSTVTSVSWVSEAAEASAGAGE